MSNAKCLNLSHPIVKQNIKDISKQLGLQDSTISLNEYKAIVRAFSIYKGIENEDVLDYIGSQEYDDFLNNYFNIGKSIEFSSDLEEKILEFLEQNKEYINTPLEDTTENRMIANGIYIATEEKAHIINLADNKFIIKVNSVNETNSLEDINIYKHLLHKDIISEEDYIEFITEFELNRDKTDSFLYNFVTKILQVNPKNKRDKSISLTVDNYPTSDKIFSDLRTRDNLIKNVLGLYTLVDFDSETFEEELKDYIENRWEKDLYDELIRLDKEKLVRLDSLYKEKATLKHNIFLLQSYLRSKDSSSKEVLEYIESFKWNKKENTSISQHIAYELKKKKEELASLEEKIKHYRFSNAAKTLKVKNRLAALYNIENAKELIFNRIKADRDSYKVSKEEWEEKVAPYIPLYEKAVKASKNAELLDYNNLIFENKKSLDEITVDEIYDNLIKFNPELKPLLDFIRTVNPKLKIKVYNTEDYENLAERKGDYLSGASASIYFPRKNEIGFRLNADTPTILHELLHSVSSYGLVGSSKDQKALGENVIQPFIDYIDNYLKQNVGNFGVGTFWGAKLPARIYGLNNPAEFIAELFSNKDFQELLDSIPPMEKKQYNSLLEEIIDSILEFVKNIFSPKTNETALDQAKQLALAVIRTQQEHMEEIYEQLANMEDTVQKQILGKGELISSSAKSSAFARQLTNPKNNLTVEYRGHTFRNAEHAYQTWKSGEFDEKAYKSKAFKPVGSKKVNKAVNFDIMVEIITAKLQQHPELIQGINERGGLEYILNSTHEVTGDKYWESSGENKFIEALAKAYKNVISSFLSQKQEIDTLKQDLGGGEEAVSEIKDAVKVAKRGLSFEEALKGQESFFDKSEKAKIKKALKGKNLQVMSVSRQTDPAFFAKEIIAFLKQNAKKDLSDPTRVNAIELWSKHDGLPIKDILDACKKYRVAPIVSFSITGLGGTALEGGVMKYQDLLQRIGELINNGTLNPTTTTVRIDPILPGVTNMDDIRKIVETAKSFGIKKFVTSLVQSYGYTEGTFKDRKVISGINNALATEGKTYDWDKYYGKDSRGKINFKPKQKVIDEIGKVLLELDKDPEITIQTCAFGIKGLKVSACLDPMIIERIVGVDVLRKDGTYDRDTSRPECMCYGCHGDFFKGQNKKCYSSCAYCYAAHSSDNKFNYYNEDGTLKDNDFTRTDRAKQQATSKKSVTLAEVGYKKGDPQKNPNIDYVFTDNAEAYIYVTKIPTPVKAKFPNPNAPKINVSDIDGTNQAGIRTDNKGNITSNAYGIVVKKYQQNARGKYVAKEGQFKDTKEDFTLFTFLNENMFDRLEMSTNKQIVFPTQMALGKAALPKRFAEWLQTQLKERFGIESSIEKNTKSGYEGYGLNIQSVTKEDNVSTKKGKKKTTLEDRVAEIENVYKTFKKVVFQGENFKKDHKYTIIEDGEEYDVDFSATTLNKALKSKDDLKDFSKIKNEELTPPNGGVYPQRFVGNGFDAVVRKYFNGGINHFDSFENISTGLKKSLLTQLKQLEKHFDSEFGEGKYKVITGFGDDEFVVGGYVSDAEYSYAVAGTLDMIVVTEDGDIYIYDMKTDSHKKGISKDNIQKYQGQLTLYKRFIAENFPELANRIKGIRIISADVRFGDLTAEDIHKGASIEFEAQDDGTLLHNGVPVEEKEGFVTIKINVTKGDNYSLVDLKQSALIESLEIDPLTFEEEKTLEETLASKTTDPITELEKIETANDDSKKFKGSSEYKEFESDDEVDFTEENTFKTLVKPTERVYLGRQIMKTMSDFLNHLHTDDSFRLRLVDITGEPIYEKENYFVEKDRDKILTKELMSEIFEYIKEEYFNYKDMEVDDPEFEKTRWIHNNFTALVNGAFAELIELEGVSLVGGEVVQVGQEDNPVTNEDLSYREENAKQAYDISNRNTSVIAHMNQTVKRELSLIHDYEYKEDGTISTVEINGEDFPLYNTDKDFDIPKFLDKDVVITTIQKIVYSKKKVSGMIKALKAERANYPWLEQVISKLEANKDNYQSKFFNTFYKSRTNYIKVYKEEEGFGADKQATYIHADLRDSAKRDAILDKLNKKLFAEIEEELPPIFTKEEDNNAPGLVSVDRIQLEIFKEALKDLQGKKKKARETADEKAERVRKGLSDVFEILGIDEDVSLNYILDSKNKNRLNSLIENFKALEKAFIARSTKKEAVIAEDITNPYYGISETLAYFLKDHVEISYYDNGDNWMVFTQPTYIQTLIEKLRGAEVEEETSYEESLGNLMKYNQFVSVGEDGSRVFVSKWLEELVNNPNSREIINHFVRTSIDNKKHFKQSTSEYLLGMLINFAAPTATNSKYDVPKDVAMYRMPIMSDKPAGDMLLFKKYGGVDLNNPKNNYNLDYMKEQIADMSFNFFKLEVNRMRAIREQLVEQVNSDVEFYHIPRTKDKKAQWVTKDSKGKVVPIQFSHKKFIETRGLRGFNGFKFHYCPMFNAEMDNNTEVAQLILDIINSSDENIIAEKFDALQERFTDIFIAGKEAEYQTFITNYASKLNKKALFNSIPQIGSEKQYDAFMQDFFWNDSFATMNIYNLTIIDPAFYKNTIDLQKRYAQMHASTSKVNTEAKFDFVGDGKHMEEVSDGKSRVLYISDLNVPSELAKVIPSLFKKLANEEKDPTRKLELQILADNLAYEYNSIDVTDGQSYGTLTSFWKKLYMLGEDTPELNKAILDLKGNVTKIENGEFSLENYDLCLQAFKPFVYSQIEHPNDTQALGKYLCPTQIKNSEALIYLGMSILKGFKTKGFTDGSHILSGIMEVVEESHWTKEGNYRKDGIDTIAFHSAVKNGDYAEIDLNDCKDKAAVVSRLKQCLYGHPTEGSRYDQKFVKEYSFLEWGKQQEVPGHMQDHEQGEGSQNRVIVVSDLPDDFELKVGSKTYKTDKKGNAKAKLLKRYFDLIAEEMEDGVYSVREELQLDSENKADKYKAISKYIINSIVKDAKYTDEMRKAFTALENGDFVGAIGDPSIADKLFSATFSLIKKNVNDQKFPGGPVVVTSVYGSENLGIAFDNPKTQEGMYYQIMITCPTEDLERRITVNTKKINSQMKKAGVKNLSRQYVDGELFDVVDALALGLITEDETLVECQRIPTEDKYSIFRCRVVKFLPRQIGERFVGPKEITRISGMDMDIDKVFTKFKYNLKSLEKKEKEGTLKPKERELLRARRRRNEIFDIQYAVLGHPMSYANTLNTGNFEPLKALANKVDTSRGAEHSLMNISGQLYFFEQNGGGKEYVGIAALNNIAHHMCNIAELSFTEFPYFTINGRHSFNREKDELTVGNYRFDRTYSIFDDSRISRTIGMFVGASADNAKEAVLASINIIPTTATLAKGLLRMGIPLDTVVYMLNHPAVKNATRIALEANKASAFTSALAEALSEAQTAAKYDKSIEELVANTNFLDEDLYSRTQDNSILEKDALFDIRVLGFLNMMMPYCQAIADVSIVTSLNSTKNSVGPRVLDTIKRQLKIQRLFRDVRNGTSLISDSLLNIYDKIPYLKVLEECFSKLVPEICGDLSPVYAQDFLNLISILESNGLDVVYMEEKDFNKLLNSWLLYKASGNKGVLDASFENRKKMIYDFPLRFIQAQRNGSLDNEFIKSLNTPTTMNKRNKILNITFNSIGKSRGTRSDLAASWEELATSDNSARRELSNDLMTYMMFRFGWSFSPKSAMNIAPNKAKEAYPNYKEIFSTTDEFNVADMMNFLYQYARNNWYGKMWVNPHLESNEGTFQTVNGKSYYIVRDAERLAGLNFLKLGKNRYIRVNEVSFVKVERLGIENNFFEFDGSSSNGIFMKSVIDNSSTNKQKKDYTGLQVEDNTIEDFDEENEDDNSGVISSSFNSPEATMPEYINHKELKALLDNKKVLKAIEEKGFKTSFNKEVKAGNVDVVYEMLEKIAEAMTTILSEEEIQKSYKNILKKFKEDRLC